MSLNSAHDENRKRLWDHLKKEAEGYRGRRGITNPDAYALFQALSQAYTSCDTMHGQVPIDRELVQYLAGWALKCLEGQPKGGVLEPDANHFLRRSYIGFFDTIRRAIKKNQLRYFKDGRIMYGCLELPKWLVEFYTAEAQQEAERRKQWRREYPVPLMVVADNQHPSA